MVVGVALRLDVLRDVVALLERLHLQGEEKGQRIAHGLYCTRVVLLPFESASYFNSSPHCPKYCCYVVRRRLPYYPSICRQCTSYGGAQLTHQDIGRDQRVERDWESDMIRPPEVKIEALEVGSLPGKVNLGDGMERML